MSSNPKLYKLKGKYLSEFDFKTDAKRHRNRKKWKDNREEFLTDISHCEWCNRKPDEFHIHHKWSKNIGIEWFKSTDEAFLNSNQYESQLTSNRVACPNCFSLNYSKRKTKEPKYRCSDCKREFSQPKEYDGKQAILKENIPNKPYITEEYTEAKIEWIEGNPDEMMSVFKDRYEQLLDEYTDLREDQCVAICDSCHYKEEKTNLRRCSKCHSEWHKPNKELCWDCLKEEKNLTECDCGEGWYSVDMYESCSRCR